MDAARSPILHIAGTTMSTISPVVQLAITFVSVGGNNNNDLEEPATNVGGRQVLRKASRLFEVLLQARLAKRV
jgi:hypothetical protein